VEEVVMMAVAVAVVVVGVVVDWARLENDEEGSAGGNRRNSV